MRIFWCLAVLAGTAAAQANLYTREKEIALGEQLSREFRKHSTPLPQEAAAAYVNRLGAALAAHMPGGWSYRFELIEEDAGGPLHEPVAIPGGTIFISQYLIGAAHSEAEFAGMLAHAMAHVGERHATRLMTRGIAPPYGWANGLPGGAPPPNTAFQRSFEREADWVAVRAMAEAGEDPAGLISYLERVQPTPGRQRALDVLPDKQERVASIQKEIAKLPALTYPRSDEFARVKASLQQ